jgi:hypothetical protein
VKVAFYTYPEWAFGTIHEALCRELYKYGVIAHIIDWNREYSERDFESFATLYDVFVTVPGSAVSLLKQRCGLTDDRIVVIAHGKYDVEYGLQQGQSFNSFKGYAVVGNSVREFSQSLGVTREPKVLRNGVHFDMFYREATASLSTLGYGGAMSYNSFDQKTEIKRGWLAADVAERTGLAFSPVANRHYLTMPSYYESVSCVLMTSSEESFGLPMIEAAAAGRLPVGTEAGIFKDCPDAGIVLPVEAQQFTEGASKAILERLTDPELCRNDCLKFQEYARYNFDWSIVAPAWIDVICN